jgi:hypothetical protein
VLPFCTSLHSAVSGSLLVAATKVGAGDTAAGATTGLGGWPHVLQCRELDPCLGHIAAVGVFAQVGFKNTRLFAALDRVPQFVFDLLLAPPADDLRAKAGDLRAFDKVEVAFGLIVDGGKLLVVHALGPRPHRAAHPLHGVADADTRLAYPGQEFAGEHAVGVGVAVGKLVQRLLVGAGGEHHHLAFGGAGLTQAAGAAQRASGFLR